jgi:hypothetical protein
MATRFLISALNGGVLVPLTGRFSPRYLFDETQGWSGRCGVEKNLELPRIEPGPLLHTASGMDHLYE